MIKQQHIGYWLKHLDETLTKHIDDALSSRGFTRPRWQALNIIYEGSTVTRQEVFATMKTFIDASQLDRIISGFVSEGWLVQHGDGDASKLTLTEAGRAEREVLFQLQSEVRKRAMQGVTEQEYTTVISVLQRMAENLE